jgi:YHS domain-containing protein
MTFPGTPATGSSSVPGTPRVYQNHQYNTSQMPVPQNPGMYQQNGYGASVNEPKPSFLKRMFSGFRNPFRKSSPEPVRQVVVPPQGQVPQGYPQPVPPQANRPQGYPRMQPTPQPTFRQPNPYAGTTPQSTGGPAFAAPGGGLAGSPAKLRTETPREKKELLPFTESPADARVDDLGLALQQSEKQEQSQEPATAASPQPPAAEPPLAAFGQDSEPKSPPASPYSGLVLAPNENERAVPRMTPDYEDDESEDEDEDLELADDAAPPAPGTQAAEQPAGSPELRTRSRDQQLQLIAARGNLRGMKGFCPVELKNNRKLVNASPLFQSDYLSKTYSFSSAEAKAEFDSAPERYAPAYAGNDIVRLANGEVDVEGSLDHAVWYRGQLFLFTSAESRDTFSSSPGKFAPTE